MRLLGRLMEQDDKKYDVFRALRLYAKGKIGYRELFDTDNIFYNIIKSDSPFRGDDTVILEFDTEDDMLSTMSLDDDDSYMVRVIDSYYSDYSFLDWDHTMDNFKDGYTTFDRLDQENIEKLNLISKYLLGKPFEPDNEYQSDLVEKLDKVFEKQLNDIVSTFNYYINRQMRERATEEINKDINEFLSKYDIELGGRYDRMKTSITNLISLYAMSGKYKSDLRELLAHYFGKDSNKIGGWFEDSYQFERSSELDWTSINREVGTELDSIIEKIEYDEGDLKKFIDLYDRITSKYHINKWYDLPKDPNYMFRISDFKPEELKISVQFTKKGGPKNVVDIKAHAFTEDGFNKFLYQPELFPIWKN